MALFEDLTTVEIAQTIAPQFKECGADLDALNFFIEYYASCLSVCVYGDKWRLAIAYRALHEVTMSQIATRASASGATGSTPIVSARAGEVSVSYAAPSAPSMEGVDAYLNLSLYGKKFLELRKTSPKTTLTHSLYCFPYGEK